MNAQPAPTPAKKKSGPPKGTHCRARVDMDALKVVKGLPLPVTLITGGYAERFAKMEPKDAIECKPEEVVSVANAMRKWIRDVGQHGKLQVITEKFSPSNPKVGHVWLWPVSEIEALPPRSRGGHVLGKQRAAARKSS